MCSSDLDALRDYEGPGYKDDEGISLDYVGDLAAALSAIVELEGLDIEVCGTWVWVTGDTRTHKDALKGAGFKWARKKQAWYFRPQEWRSFSRGGMSLDEIRVTHGSSKVAKKGRAKLTAA